MGEQFQFQSVRSQIEKKKIGKTVKPISEARESTPEEELGLKEYWLSLRQSIQEKMPQIELTEGEKDQKKRLSELISSESLSEYNNILSEFNRRNRQTAEHPNREFIDIEDESLAKKIDDWIDHLISEVAGQAELNEAETAELRAQAWMFFGALSNVMNTNAITKDISAFFKSKKESGTAEGAAEKNKKELAAELKGRYPFTADELEILINLALSEKGKKEDYNLEVLCDTIARLWSEYGLMEKKGALAKISMGFLLAKGVGSFAPSVFQHILENDKFNASVYIEYLFLNKLSESIENKIRLVLAEHMTGVNRQINEKIINSLFFQEFEFIHERSLGEVFATLDRGKRATSFLLEGVIAKLIPNITGILLSLAFLTKVNPILGGVGVCSLPVMYVVSQHQNKRISKLYEKETKEGEKITSQISSIKSGFEEVKTSAEVPQIATHVREKLDIKDRISLEKFVTELTARVLGTIPYDVSALSGAAVGGVLQEKGMITGGEVLSNIIYSSQLYRPVQDLISLYFDQFARNIQDINRMDEILGSYQTLDMPEGEKELARVPVSELSGFDIEISNLRYKNILRGINLKIKQGEFVSIAGVSGAGKSTLLRNIVGLYKPAAGEIKIGGVPHDRIKRYGPESVYSLMSYCNQSPIIFEGMTLRQNLLLWTKREVSDERIKQVLTDLRLDKLIGRLDDEPKNLSGGERVRIGVARTLLKNAKIMLLDEPTASLHSEDAAEVLNAIQDVKNKYPDTTIICVSHDEALLRISEHRINMSELQPQE